ncbi:MAG: hypothetical protein PHQ40_14355 [Anaerolineaceae bacterium]|nr:hypothetical protein [Anaerolineaceae bacterium]
MEPRHLFSRWIPALLMIGLSACSLPMKPVPGSSEVATPTSEVIILPTLQPTLSLPTVTTFPEETATSLPAPTQKPTQPPTPTPTQANPVISPVIGTTYGVILISPGDTLPLRSQPASTTSIVENLDPQAKGITLTGKDAKVGGIHWVEANVPSGNTGWLNQTNLTAFVSPLSFSTDNQVTQLIDAFTAALNQKDGKQLASLISPLHGLRLQYLRGGTIAIYDQAKASWVFDSSYQTNWGLHPGSGLPVKASFSQEVLPALLDVLNSKETKVTYENISTGGTTYDAAWPKEYANINFLSLYRPGPASQEQNWRTWLIGIEYSEGKPYLFALNQLIWEP